MNFLDAAGLARFFSGLGQKFAALSHTHGTADIEDGAITTDKLANMCVTTSKLGNKCVANGNLGDMCVQEGKLYPQAVTTAKIRDGAVTEDKLDAALKSKINAGGGATVLYETSSPSEMSFDQDWGTQSLTLTTPLTDADPQAVVVFFSTKDYNAPMMSAMLKRPTGSRGWANASNAALQFFANASDFGRSSGYGTDQTLFKGSLTGQNSALTLAALDAYYPTVYIYQDSSAASGYAGDIEWGTRSLGYTPRIYIWKVVGV